jgi:DNA polymerase-1
VRIYKTTEPAPNSSHDQDCIYNALDCLLTIEVFEVLEKQLDEVTRQTYELEKSLQGPVLEMQIRGVKVDASSRDDLIKDFSTKILFLEESLKEILVEGVGVDISPTSPKQLQYLLYDVLGLPVQRNFRSGQPTTDRKALEKLRSYFHAAPIINHILAIRDCYKKIGMLRSSIDGDGRIRTSFNIAGTDTGRFNSYVSSFGSGSNLQTVTPELRKVFVSDEGHKMAYIDLEQAESRAVGAIEWNLFKDGAYLDACESGDLHTAVAKMCWSHLAWTGDLKKDKALAKQIFYRDVDYRQGAKKLSHASNYFGGPPEIAKQTGIPLQLVQSFQPNYFRAFPSHQKWHAWVSSKLMKDGFITTFMGRRRTFFGRRWERDTIKAAVAYEPQGSIADYLNRGMLAVWKANVCQLLLQQHDAILIQYREEVEDEIIPRIKKMLELEIPLLYGRSLVIPTEAKVGWNWGEANETNPNGLVVFTGHDTRIKQDAPSLLDRKFSAA